MQALPLEVDMEDQHQNAGNRQNIDEVLQTKYVFICFTIVIEQVNKYIINADNLT